MKPVFTTKEELARYFDFLPTNNGKYTTNDILRLEKAWYCYITDYKHDGCMGCCAEILSATPNSKKTTVSNSGKADNFINYRTESGAVIPVWCERKTSGGRIETIETELSKAETLKGKFVIYSMDVCNANTSGKRRFVPAVVIPRKQFIAKLVEFNAIKTVQRTIKDSEGNIIDRYIDGFAIQVSKKEWYEWLLDYPIVFDRTAVYSDDDFEDLF